MTSKTSFVKTTVFLTCFIYLLGMWIYPLIPRAHALFWQDDTPDNNPNEIQHRPGHFGLFDWIGHAEKDAQRRDYRRLDNPDRGPGVDNGARVGVILLSGTVGTGAGLFCAYEFTPNNSDMTAAYITDGALGLCAGIIVGVLIMPRDYEVDPEARNQYLKEQQDFAEGPIQLQIKKAFHPTLTAFSLKF